MKINTQIILNSSNFLAIAACLLWASAFAGVKIGLKYNAPLQFAGIRFFISGLLILPFILKTIKGASLAAREYAFVALVGVVQVSIQYALFYSGMNLVPGSLGAMVVGSGPLFVALVAHFYMPNDTISFRKMLIIGLGLLGVGIITLGKNRMGAVGISASYGILLLIANNILSGVGNVLVARHGRRIHPFILSSFSMLFGGAILWTVGIMTEGYKHGPFPLEYYFSLGWLSFLSAAAISIWYLLLKRKGVKVSNLNMWKFLIPVVGAILSWLLLPNEEPSSIAIAGMFLVAASLVVLNRTRGG